MYGRVSFYHHNHQNHNLHHQRPPLNSSKKTVVIVKSPRPGLSKAFSSARLHKTAIAKSKPSATDSLREDLDADAMPTTFHQFCTTCEKQIPTPNSAILYCSESCRRRDSSSPAPPCSAVSSNRAGSVHDNSSSSNRSTGIDKCCRSSSSSSSPIEPLASPLTEYEAFIGRQLLSRRKPSSPFPAVPPAAIADFNQSSSSSSSFRSSIPAVLHDGKADMDPTEWKPDAMPTLTNSSACGITKGGSATRTRTRTAKAAARTDPDLAASDSSTRAHSAAYLYLSQFHRSADNFAALSNSGGQGSTYTESVENNIIPTRGQRSVNSLFVSTGAPDSSDTSNSDASSNDSSSADSSIANSPSSATTSPTLTTARTTATSSGTPSIFVDEEDGHRICLAEGTPALELVQEEGQIYAKEPVKSIAEISIVTAEVGELGKLLGRSATASD